MQVPRQKSSWFFSGRRMRRRTTQWDWNGSKSSRLAQRLLWSSSLPRRSIHSTGIVPSRDQWPTRRSSRNSSPVCGRTWLLDALAQLHLTLEPVSRLLDPVEHATAPDRRPRRSRPSRSAINADESYMESYIQTDSQSYFEVGKSRCHPGCNPDGKVAAAKLRFRFAIPPRPCRIGSSVRQLTPPADPSLPTTERGISERVWQKTA